MIKVEGRTLVLPQGDTALLAVRVTGAELGPNDRAVFAIYDPDEQREILKKTQVFVDNVAVLKFVNADTQDFEAKDYQWDFRVVIGAVFDADDNVYDGLEVHSPLAIGGKLPKFRLREVGRYV